MSHNLCHVCQSNAAKYKCPQDGVPFCSVACGKQHKDASHDGLSTNTRSHSAAPAIPEMPAPKPRPSYLKGRDPSSIVPTFKELLEQHPEILPVLQQIYARTIPPEVDVSRRQRSYGGSRSQKKLDEEAMKLLKDIRLGNNGSEQQHALDLVMQLVQENNDAPAS
ncbi:hypothetical protein BDV96DRAFT_509524 [Lophiotrema nucula]|uniref:HIT-type domain-containing protein n=1 Tax=Lophiotrema nucula TaxID=690887 RepID=A0A6A5YEN3_9PLEO|nr:hypothetical protein BDV96DRAFT_509524 [Lophiotrema nucula]